MTIQEIYTRYKIIPSLQLHQYRVAGVALDICNNLKGRKIDTHEIVVACLLHDMGNIIKFNMEIFPDFFQPEGVEYWQKIKDEFLLTYGTDEHVATMAIVEEILQADPIKNRVLDLVEAIGFSNAKRNSESKDFGWKIAAYADMRVEPHGVTTLQKRLEDGNKRFKINKPGVSSKAFFDEMASYIAQIENQIFERLPYEPVNITENTIVSSIDNLKKIEIGS